MATVVKVENLVCEKTQYHTFFFFNHEEVMWSRYSRRQCLTFVAGQIKICWSVFSIKWMKEQNVSSQFPLSSGREEWTLPCRRFLSSHHTLFFTAWDILCFLKRCERRHCMSLPHSDQHTRDCCWSSLMILPGCLLEELLVGGPMSATFIHKHILIKFLRHSFWLTFCN